MLAPEVRGAVRAEDLHEADYTPWEGHAITGWPAMTVLRGKVVVEDGELLGDPADGKYLKREVPEAVRAGPGV